MATRKPNSFGINGLLDRINAFADSAVDYLQSLPRPVLAAMGFVVVVAIGALLAASLYLRPKPSNTNITPGITGAGATTSTNNGNSTNATAGSGTSGTIGKSPSATKTSAPPAPVPPGKPNNSGPGALTLNVTGASVEVSPTSSVINPIVGCSQDFTFTGTISVSGSGTVKYEWDRSDGTVALGSLDFSGSGQHTLTDIWKVSGTGTGSEHLTVTAPNSLVSNDASYTFVKTVGC